jgi:hypothetical protein
MPGLKPPRAGLNGRTTLIYDEGYMMDQRTIEGIEEGARAAGQKRVDAIGKQAKAAGVPFASVVTKGSSSYEEIINTAKKRKCDVLFMASHGRRGLSKLMMGSVTQKVHRLDDFARRRKNRQPIGPALLVRKFRKVLERLDVVVGLPLFHRLSCA